jgi:hypothetical protein
LFGVDVLADERTILRNLIAHNLFISIETIAFCQIGIAQASKHCRIEMNKARGGATGLCAEQ